MIQWGFRNTAVVGGSSGFFALGGLKDEVEEGGVTYIRHRFTNTAETEQFVVYSGAADVHVLTVAGGGQGGSSVDGWTGGGGGAGGWLLNGEDELLANTTPLRAEVGFYDITVGGPAQNTSAFGITVTRGGRGGAGPNGGGQSGGSGGGAGSNTNSPGAGVAGPPRQGFNGNSQAGAGWGGSGGGAGGGAPGGQPINQAPGKTFLGIEYARGGGQSGSGNPGSGGGVGYAFRTTPGNPGQRGEVVIAYPKS